MMNNGNRIGDKFPLVFNQISTWKTLIRFHAAIYIFDLTIVHSFDKSKIFSIYSTFFLLILVLVPFLQKVSKACLISVKAQHIFFLLLAAYLLRNLKQIYYQLHNNLFWILFALHWLTQFQQQKHSNDHIHVLVNILVRSFPRHLSSVIGL